MTKAEKWRTLAQVLAITVPMGMLIGFGLGWLIGGDSSSSLAAGTLIGFLVAVGMVSFDVSWAVGLIPRGWREAPFLVVLVTRSFVWLAVIVIGISLPLLTVAGVSFADLVDQQFIVVVAASFFAALLFNFVAQVNRLLGRRMLVRLILGRYHRPREEIRVFLLIDVRGSTQIAERLGNLQYHAFLRRFISDVTGSVVRFRGEVHRYVGDEVILTWTAEEGLSDARCVKVVFAISDTLETVRTEYEADFGIVPTFWAGLHLGPVVAGEIGTIKQEIAFLGDTLNAAARIEQAGKELEHQFLASAAVISALDLPSDFATESLGRIELRGIEDSLELFAITRVADRMTV
ncbi:MAG TPA: adenylate/guanylate cyclase domain-containing protein [Acidimicrobiia bacterium]